jgi:hypothetical protein
MKLTGEEITLLQQLRDNPQGRKISGNKPHRALDRLVAAQLVKDTAVSMGAVLYEITSAGKAALAAAEHPHGDDTN